MRLLFIFFLVFCNIVFANETVVTSSGETVVLMNDGTWRSLEQSSDIIEKITYRNKNDDFSIEVNKSIWGVVEDKQNHDSDFEFKHLKKDAYALIILENIPFSLDAIKTSALENFYEIGENLEIINEETKNINGQEFLMMEISFDYMGTKLFYSTYYATGSFGSIQALAYTSDKLYGALKKDFSSLLESIRMHS